MPFTTKKKMEQGRWVERANFECGRCGARDEFPVVGHAGRMSIKATIAGAAHAGWLAAEGSARVECPRCVTARKDRAKGESPGPKAEVIMLQPVAKPLTPDQRLRIRALLDKHFDDGAGRYLDGYSDQRGATELNLPRIHVETIREAAYGAIRVPPEMEAAEKAVAALEARLKPAETIAAEIDKLLAGARTLVEAARKALAA